MRLMITFILSIFTLSSLASEEGILNFELYAENYINALKKQDERALSKLTSSENINIHKVNLITLNKVQGLPYKIDVSPYDGTKNDFVALLVAMSEGKCDFSNKPTHKIDLSWNKKIEKFHKTHPCHYVTNETSSITLIVQATNNQIKDVLNCSKDYKTYEPQNIKINNIGINTNDRNEVKKWLRSQSTFSKIKTYEHIKKTYGIAYDEASVLVDNLCSEL